MPKTFVLAETKAAYAVPQEMIPPTEPTILVQAGEPIAALLPMAEYERYRQWRAQETHHQTDADQLAAERHAWLAMKAELLRTHAGQFVCFRDSRLVDTDPDEQELIERVRARFPNGPIFVQEVTEQPRVYRILSPHVVTA